MVTIEILEDILSEVEDSFIWWYFDHYNLSYDPFGMYGYNKSKRIVLTHIRLRGSNLEMEFLDFLINMKQHQIDYDCLANFDYEKVNSLLKKKK